MAEHNETGKKGEEIAAKFLEQKGYRILETNWRSGRHEVDIIAKDGDFLVIAEVKTRHSAGIAEPEVAVTREKQRALVQAANSYVLRKNLDSEVRFDIVSILLEKDGEKVNHIIDAFYPLVR
jgi:putative endonuclease